MDEKALKIVRDYIFAHLDKTDTVPPFDVYMVWKCKALQNWKYLISSTDDGAVLITGSIQARRLYYHPEYNFQRGKNHNAGAYWLEPYISGEKKDFVRDKYTELFRRRAGL